jgi:hypothetical protein
MARGVTPVVAIVVLVGVTVLGVAGVTTVVVSLDDRAATAASPTLAVSADADRQAITVSHRGGASFHLENATVRTFVDGEPLAHQPPVPYFAAEGFRGTPTGPFNSGGESLFEPGETGTIQLATTNSPLFDSGDRVTVTVARNGRTVARSSVRAG